MSKRDFLEESFLRNFKKDKKIGKKGIVGEIIIMVLPFSVVIQFMAVFPFTEV